MELQKNKSIARLENELVFNYQPVPGEQPKSDQSAGETPTPPKSDPFAGILEGIERIGKDVAQSVNWHDIAQQIRTGTRNLIMLAGRNGHYSPAEVRIGADSNGQTEILAGLSEGERIVASGQFLIDSEASLSGVAARPVTQ